jgi:hypothetical protein
MKRILCILQNAWGDRQLPIVFRPNPNNKSAKVVKKMVGDYVFHFSNTKDEMTPTAKGKPKPNFIHFKKVIDEFINYDLILVCGKQAKDTVEKNMYIIEPFKKPLLFVPHPASRSLSNLQIAEINHKINEMLNE